MSIHVLVSAINLNNNNNNMCMCTWNVTDSITKFNTTIMTMRADYVYVLFSLMVFFF